MIRAVLTAICLGALALPVAAIEVAEVVAKANHAAYYQGRDGRARVKMTIADAQGRERVREFTILRLNTGEAQDAGQKLYVYFQRPADVSRTTFLVWKKIDADDDRWLYLPALDLVKRIAASDERSSFVGSHFFYEDVSGRVPHEDTHELIEESQNYYVVQSTPKDPQRVEFASYRNWIHRSTFLPVKTEFLDASGKVYRSYEVLRVETIDGVPTVMESRMSDTRIGGSTTMSYLAVSYDIGLPEDVFSERFLRNPPREHLK